MKVFEKILIKEQWKSNIIQEKHLITFIKPQLFKSSGITPASHFREINLYSFFKKLRLLLDAYFYPWTIKKREFFLSFICSLSSYSFLKFTIFT